jgi:DnaJ-class molecular chaperone
VIPGNPSYPPGFDGRQHAARFGEPMAKRKMDCPACDGTGTVGEDEPEPCEPCGGTGKVEIDE